MKDEMKKLDYIAEKLFRVIKNTRNTTYELDISNFKVYNVFNAFLLDKADECASLTKTLKVKVREKEYKVRKILRKRKNKGKKEFLIS